MRTIKFRGKRIDNGEWVYGYLYELPLESGNVCMILTTDNIHKDNSIEPQYHLAFTLWKDLFVVDSSTVGQYTGLNDKNGNEIYEGDKVEPKFREREWIIHQGTQNIYQVVARIDNKYQLKYGDNYTIQKCADVDRCARLWDITKDAKKGDVLVHNSLTFIFIGIEKGVVKAYEGTLCTGRIACNFGEPNIDKDYCPANKEQIDNLFNMIRKSGYEWNNEKKELKKIE